MRVRVTGMAPFLGAAAAFFCLGCVSVLLELQSPSFVMFSGIKVHAYTQRGITSYEYDGEHFSLDNPRASPYDDSRRPTTVWLSHSDPTDQTKAYIDSRPTRWVDIIDTSLWFVVALGFIVGGLVRSWRGARMRARYLGLPGGGLPDDLVRRLLAAQRGSVR